MARGAWVVAAVAVALGISLLIARHDGPVSRHGPMSSASVPSDAPPPGTKPSVEKATITVHGPGMIVPSAFLGLSTEYWTVPMWRRHLALVQRVLAHVHVRGDAPLVLRIGGDSSDQAVFGTGRGEDPEWLVELTPGWLRQAGTLVRRARLRVILDLNLLTSTPRIGARWARVAAQQLPRRSIAGFEIGNEPDIYHRGYRLKLINENSLAAELLPGESAATSYAQDFHAYARRVSRVAPHVPLLGPALADPLVHLRWVSKLLAGPHPRLGAVSAHQYPYSACEPPGSRGYPTIARVLGDVATIGMVRSVRPALRATRRAGLPFRLTELNSVTCGGRRGVSDTFATALWAPDALFELLRAGVDGVRVHIRPHRINEAFSLTGHGLVAHPLLYGLIAFSRTLGPDARLVGLRLHTRHPSQLKAWAVRVNGDALHVLIIDKGIHPVKVLLRLPATGRGTVRRLRAPSVASRSGVTFAGQRLGGDGRWHGKLTREIIRRRARGYALTVSPRSAALVSVPHAARR